MATELTTEQGMHIDMDPKTGAIAASPAPESIGLKKEAEEHAATEEKIVDPRKDAMDLIYANRTKAFEKELETAVAQGFGATVEQIKDDQPEEIERKPEENQVTKNDEKVTKENLTNEQEIKKPEQKRVIMVDGRPIEFTEEEYAKLAERGMFQPQIQQAAQVVQQPQQIQPKKADEAQESQPTDALRDIARRITYGNEEESTKAIADLINTAVQRVPQGDPARIAQVAAQQALAQIQFQNNLETIAREYADVYEKRASTIVAADYVNSLRHKYNMLGQPRSDLDLYREACQKTREDFGFKPETIPAKVEKQSTVQSADLGNKLERKRAAPKTLVAATKISEMEQQTKATTGSDIVAQMRKSRGQASA